MSGQWSSLGVIFFSSRSKRAIMLNVQSRILFILFCINFILKPKIYKIAGRRTKLWCFHYIMFVQNLYLILLKVFVNGGRDVHAFNKQKVDYILLRPQVK